jgi:3-phenylpropionate/trans-cinnamate dioxygenase ferredoxin reductase subunit
MNDRGVVIVGAGECGTRAAFALREEGYAGPVTLIGAERHLPYERPPLSKEGMVGTATGMKVIADAGRLQAAGIRLIPATQVVVIDRAARRVELSAGGSLPYEKLLLATGAQPRRLPLAENSRHCAYLRTHDDAEAIADRLRPQASIVIVGGGFIGLELAAAASQRGCAVTVLEMLPRLLARAVPAEIASVIELAHRSHGVDIRCGVSLAETADTAGGVGVTLGDGSRIDAALCIVGIGAIPDTALAERAGLAVENGIRVDDRLRTEDPAIFAAGDCCAFPLALYGGRRVRLEAWRNAQDQGTLAARNMLGKDEAHNAVPWFWSDQYDLTLQVAGLVDEGVEVVRRDFGDGAFILFHLDANGRLVAASGIGKGNAVARDVRLAEMLIAREATLPREKLAAADVKLKTLLAA